MPKNLQFTIEFYKIINSRNNSQKPTIGERREIGEQASFYIETLVSLMVASGAYAVDNKSSDEYMFHLENVGELINALMSSVRENLVEIDERRIELEKIVGQLPTNK